MTLAPDNSEGEDRTHSERGANHLGSSPWNSTHLFTRIRTTSKKRTMTYLKRSFVKRALSNLRFNESDAQRHNRIVYRSNVPQWVSLIRPQLEPLEYLKRHPAAVSCRRETRLPNSVGAKKNAPVQTPGASQQDDRSYWLATLCNPA
jgi:hypothetical protein